jgi:hypothetical protein
MHALVKGKKQTTSTHECNPKWILLVVEYSHWITNWIFVELGKQNMFLWCFGSLTLKIQSYALMIDFAA